MIRSDCLIAPCGMDCSHCSAYLNHVYGQIGKVGISCAGCRPRDKKCGHIIKRCEKLLKHEVDFCFECEMFPCEHLERLEARYIKNGYANSFIGNNIRIKEIGEEAFQAEQNSRFACPDCGGPVSIHEGICYKCFKSPRDSFFKRSKRDVKQVAKVKEKGRDNVQANTFDNNHLYYSIAIVFAGLLLPDRFPVWRQHR